MKCQKTFILFAFLLLVLCRPCAASTFEEFYRNDGTIFYVDMSSLEKVRDTTYETKIMRHIPVDDARLFMLVDVDLGANRTRMVEKYRLVDGKPHYEEVDESWKDIVEGQPEAYLRDRLLAFLKHRLSSDPERRK